jgi:hypothetical protein
MAIVTPLSIGFAMAALLSFHESAMHCRFPDRVTSGKILDPFAGSGTALFTASAMGLDADGIELLHIGQQIISTKRLLESEFTSDDFDELQKWAKLPVWQDAQEHISLNELRITSGAYPEKTKEQIEKYLAAIHKENG